MGFLRNHLPDPATYFQGQGLVLQRGAKWRTTSCHFHGGSDSMRVNTQSGAFCCMAACGARGGDVLAYQMAACGQDFISAAKALGCWQDDPANQQASRLKPLPFPPRDALEILVDEAAIAAVAAGNMGQGVSLTDDDRARLTLAAGRIRVISNGVLG